VSEKTADGSQGPSQRNAAEGDSGRVMDAKEPPTSHFEPFGTIELPVDLANRASVALQRWPASFEEAAIAREIDSIITANKGKP
jgi:hypothetical protein